jgi:transcriptional regulator with XRE-family HTH domain
MTEAELTFPDLGTVAGLFERAPTTLSSRQAEEGPLLREVANGVLWALRGWSILLPATKARPAPDVQVMTRELRQWTNWSQRRLADLLGTTHTTIGAVEEGRPLRTSHSGDLRRRLEEAHAVVLRIHLLADRDPDRTAYLLETSPQGGVVSANQLLKDRNPANAYLAALDALNPPVEGLLVGIRPPNEDRATVPLHE